MDPSRPSQLQSITAHNAHAGDHDLPVWPSNLMQSPKTHSDLGSEPPPCHPTPQRTHPSPIHSPQHEGLAKLFSTNPSLDSLQSFHTAITSLSCSSIRQASPTPTVSSDIVIPLLRDLDKFVQYSQKRLVSAPRSSATPSAIHHVTMSSSGEEGFTETYPTHGPGHLPATQLLTFLLTAIFTLSFRGLFVQS
ncbi:hypothetical protein EDB92DRAFT_1137251 [Lactarius akahatsu]|uniref:Uncharacterized protein n=1 Tax=Lactarius akahatsu TaxID=416441 RepID=A0AAD4QBM6_9AGAM|nr:hypothetical protein EDB92DRAFT_1137251 [Lactarius akahatsu]